MKKLCVYLFLFLLASANVSCQAADPYEEFAGEHDSLQAIGGLFTLYAACDSFRSVEGRYPVSLQSLGQTDPPWISQEMSSGWVGTSIIEYKRLAKDKYEILIATGAGVGERSFYMDQKGYIRLEDAQGRIIDRSPIAEKKERNQLLFLIGLPTLLAIGFYFFKRR